MIFRIDGRKQWNFAVHRKKVMSNKPFNVSELNLDHAYFIYVKLFQLG